MYNCVQVTVKAIHRWVVMFIHLAICLLKPISFKKNSSVRTQRRMGVGIAVSVSFDKEQSWFYSWTRRITFQKCYHFSQPRYEKEHGQFYPNPLCQLFRAGSGYTILVNESSRIPEAAIAPSVTERVQTTCAPESFLLPQFARGQNITHIQCSLHRQRAEYFRAYTTTLSI